MSIQEKVCDTIHSAELPVSTEYIAKKLSIGWGTALRYCLELMTTGRIQGMKTTKSWVFWVEEGEPAVSKNPTVHMTSVEEVIP
jgi:hypothetical protein